MSRKFCFGLFGIVIVLLAASVLAGNFVSYNGKFYFTYPGEWRQLDYLTVDTYLNQSGARRRALDYEGAFAPVASQPWHKDAYLILTVDTLPGITTQQSDSILKGIEDALGRPRQERTTATLLSNLTPGELYWDPATRTAAVITEVAGTRQGDKTNLLMMRFFDRGVANFYFYASDSALQSSLPTFGAMVASLSTENIESAAPRESIKIADPEKIANAGKSDRPIAMWIPTTGVVLILMAIAILARRRRQARKQK